MHRHELTGRRFDRLLVLNFHDVIETHGGTRRTRWLCRCDCGVEKVVRGQDLVTGKIQSCSCLRNDRMSEAQFVHGHAGSSDHKRSREYETWASMKARCANSKDPDYGGRGITVCDEWAASFEAFLRDMGPRPDGCEIDRQDVNGHYELGNCRWVTLHEQASNKRNTRYVEMFNGSRRPLMDVCRDMGVDYYVVHGRLRTGWSLGRAIAAPLGARRAA